MLHTSPLFDHTSISVTRNQPSAVLGPPVHFKRRDWATTEGSMSSMLGAAAPLEFVCNTFQNAPALGSSSFHMCAAPETSSVRAELQVRLEESKPVAEIDPSSQ